LNFVYSVASFTCGKRGLAAMPFLFNGLSLSASQKELAQKISSTQETKTERRRKFSLGK